MRGIAPALFPRLLITLAAGALVLGAAEALIRRLAPARISFYEPDPAALFRLRPGARARFHYPWLRRGEEVEVAINSRGFRGRELATKPGARVVVYGDSFIEARSTPLEETFPAQLEARLRERRPGSVEVLNAGVTGYGPDQVLARLQAELDQLQPDLVIIGLYAGNDWGDLVRNKLWRLDPRGRLVRGAPELDDGLRSALEERTGLRALATVRAASRLMAGLRDPAPATDEGRPSMAWALRECQREHVDALREPGRVTNLFVDHYDADVSALPRSDSARHKRRLMAEVLAAAGRLIASRAARLVLLVIPAASDVSDAYPPRVDPARFPEYRPAALTDALEEIAREARIPVVNVFGPIRENGGALFYPIDGHWNADAQALAARLVTERILSDGLLP